jgi:23S rRNA-/tRNA-specific pseudouridylate synthase
MHLTSPLAGRVADVLRAELDMSVGRAADLIAFGAVYLQRRDDARPWRVHSNVEVEVGEYLRVHPSPKRFPVQGIAWAALVIDETPDFIVVNKPALVPSGPTSDNAHENVMERVRRACGAERLYLLHRLDVETTGLMVTDLHCFHCFVLRIVQHTHFVLQVLGKTLPFTRDFNAQLKGRAVTKHYKALVALRERGHGLVLEAGDTLRHYVLDSSTSPKVFERIESPVDCVRPGWKLCEASVVSVTERVAVVRSGVLDITSAVIPPPRMTAGMRSWMSPALERGSATTSFSEVVLDLRTGRTHQVRGQLHSDSQHIAGDNLYRGCTSTDQEAAVSVHLALQSCFLGFRYNEKATEYSLAQPWWAAYLSAST